MCQLKDTVLKLLQSCFEVGGLKNAMQLSNPARHTLYKVFPVGL